MGNLSTAALVIALIWPLAALAGPPPEGDGDTIPDVLDKCSADSRNATPPATCDSDSDGYGNVCDPDFDQNGLVASNDFSMFFVPAFKGIDPPPWPEGMDMNCNGLVNSDDFSMYFVPKFKGLMGGAAPGPSGLSCAGIPGCQ